MKVFASAIAIAAVLAAPTASAQPVKPTIVLVHGAFADSSSWNGVVRILENDGYAVVAVANPLRGVRSDAAYVGDVLASISSPVVLVGHSYGGSVITEAGNRGNVKALVYVSAFAPDAGETAGELTGRFPGSTLAPTLASPVPLSDGGTDLYIRQDRFRDQFAADVPAADAALMAAAQRPIAKAALDEPTTFAGWKTVPTWFVYGDRDKNIPPRALSFMAERAHSRATVVIKGGSHVVLISDPAAVASVIERAAQAD